MPNTYQTYRAALLDATKARALFDASKGGNVRGITEDHRYELACVIGHAERARRENERTELALAAIYAVLFPNALQGWGNWSRYAAAGEWPC